MAAWSGSWAPRSDPDPGVDPGLPWTGITHFSLAMGCQEWILGSQEWILGYQEWVLVDSGLPGVGPGLPGVDPGMSVVMLVVLHVIGSSCATSSSRRRRQDAPQEHQEISRGPGFLQRSRSVTGGETSLQGPPE